MGTIVANPGRIKTVASEGGIVPENSPDYGSIYTTEVQLPYRQAPYPLVEFDDPQLKGLQAILIADTADNSDGRLATMITRFPRRVLAEMNTHRVFGRNSASSRARTLKMVIKSVMDDPFIPRFTKNTKGMSGRFVSVEEQAEAERYWLRGRDRAVDTVMELLMGERYSGDLPIGPQLDEYYEAYRSGDTSSMLSVHKQDANRVLEPYIWHEAIITSSYWKNFFDLRTDLSAADPSIYAIALLMEAALKGSTPVDSKIHLPFVSEADMLTGEESLETARPTLMLSSTESAQISYKDKASAEKSTATTALGERLLSMKHMSPFEHVAYRTDAPAVAHLTGDLSGNLSSDWAQLRRIYE